jgi:hypothetical protein
MGGGKGMSDGAIRFRSAGAESPSLFFECGGDEGGVVAAKTKRVI